MEENMTENAIEIEKLTKKFGQSTLVDNLPIE